MSERRPDPEALLERIREQEKQAQRARLKIFFGASAGVGKTYAMLIEAHERRKAGTDVVVGVLETHGRSETAALLEGLEQLPKRMIEHRDARLPEFDLDAALARRPGLLLVDELAHTNVPGSRHAKRWQDVEELLDAGIDVYTTLNVQHVDSLNDVVSQITGVIVRETVPDSIVDRADEIELIDLPPDDLLQRLREGKVYVPKQAERALENFFRKGNLIALRELALRRTAERVDKQMESWRRVEGVEEPWPVGGRILVCIGEPEEGLRLVRAARRMAAGLRAEWIVTHVQTPASLRRPNSNRDRLVDVLGFAEELGAETAILDGLNVVDELLAFARKRQVARIVIGRARRLRWLERLTGSIVSDLVRRSEGLDVMVVSGEAGPVAKDRTPAPASRSGAAAYGRALVIVAACTLIARFMSHLFAPANIAMVYLLGVVVTAVTCGRGPSILGSILSVVVFDFAFVPPYYTFAVSDSEYVITFTVMLVVGLALSTLTVRIREQAELARQREARAAALHRLSGELAVTVEIDRMLEAAARMIGETFAGPALLLLPDGTGRVAPHGGDPVAFGDDPHERAVAQWVHDRGQPAGRGTATLPAARGLYVPLEAGGRTVGVLGLRPGDARSVLAPDQMRLLRTFANQTALAIESRRASEEAEAARLRAETERTRSALLSSVSHDLRTPLAAITGAASSLLDPEVHMDDVARRDLLVSIADEAGSLDRLVRDLLQMTRLESGISPRREWHPVEELVGAALSRLDRSLIGRPVTVDVPPELFVPVEPVLLAQAIVHLVENTIRHTPPGSPVELHARREGADVIVEVSDRGPGLPADRPERVFEKFWRASAAGRDAAIDTGGPPGVGLGLAICRAIVESHGGWIVGENRPDGGATFRLSLPVVGEPPPIDAEDPERLTPAEGAQR